MAASRRMQAARRRAEERKNQRASRPDKGILVAEGDSWFKYPGTDVLSALKDLGYDVIEVADKGDTIESMAYEEDQARGVRAGIWAGEFVPPWEWRRGKRLP